MGPSFAGAKSPPFFYVMCTTRKEETFLPAFGTTVKWSSEKYLNAPRQSDGPDGETDCVFYLHGFFLQKRFAVLHAD
jgi:hypothetical protein